MTAISAPFGMRPVFHPSGLTRPRALYNGIPSGYNTNLFQGTPVAIDGTTGQVIIAASNGDYMGPFAGVEYTPSGGRPTWSNWWPANTVLQANTQAVVYYYEDVDIFYEMQAVGPVLQLAIGDGAAFVNVGAGDVGSGLSLAQLGGTLLGAAPLPVQIVDLAGASGNLGNAWGDAFTIVRVRVGRHQFWANKNGF